VRKVFRVTVTLAGLIGILLGVSVPQNVFAYNFDELSTSRIALLRATYQDQCSRPEGYVEVVDFNDYVKNVLPSEWIASWDMDALKAGALAVKTYAWYWIIERKYTGEDYDLRDDTCDQVYPYPYGSPPSTTDQAVDETWNWVMTKNGHIFQAQYDSGTAGSPDPLNPGRMSQWGTQYWAEQGKDWQWILHYYYDPIDIFIPSEKTTVTVTEEAPWFTKGCISGGDYWWTWTYNEHTYIFTYVGGPDCWAEFRPYLSQSGTYDVYVSFYADPKSSTQVPYTVYYDGGSTTIDVNQYSTSYYTWREVKLGTWSFDSGGNAAVRVTDHTGEPYDGVLNFNVDTIRFVPQGGGETLTVSLSASPSSGSAPLTDVDLTATVSGTATGTINYAFYCNRSDSGVNITPGWAYKIDGTTINPYTAYNVCDYSSPGTYTAKVIAERGSLQAESRVSIVVTSPPDTTPPPAPIGLNATPSGWTNNNSFQINWTNPSDPSGIAAAWYKRGSIPASDTDGTRTTSKPFTVSASLQGGQPIYVWLEDGAENKSHNNRSSTTLYYDGTAPTCSLSINNGASTTTSLMVTLNVNGSDTGGSGLYQMRFSNNGSTWSSWGSYNSTKSNWDLSSNGGNTNTGTKTTYCQVNDHAGNVVAAPCSDTINYSPACTYNISPSTRAFNYSGGSDTVTVTTQSGCSWTATSNKSWIHVTSGGSGTGNGTVYYSVDGNSNTSSRSGTMTIAGKTFTVNQDGAAWITITVPNGGEIGKIGDTEPIMWDAHNAGNNVELEYSTNAGSSWKNIINSTANDGEYSWTIPNDPSTQCRVKVISISYPSVFDISNDNFTIWLDTAAVFRVESTGDVLADGSFYGQKFLAGSADVAEWVPVSEPVEPGDVLELDPDNQGQYRKTSSRCSTLVAGVVSTEPGVVLGTGKDVEGKALLALLGIVPVKVTDEGGPIHPGDLLVTSSTPGYAMRWDPGDGSPCDLVGKALEPLTEESGIILVLLTAH